MPPNTQYAPGPSPETIEQFSMPLPAPVEQPAAYGEQMPASEEYPPGIQTPAAFAIEQMAQPTVQVEAVQPVMETLSPADQARRLVEQAHIDQPQPEIPEHLRPANS